MKAAELREMSDEQLTLTLKETTEGLFRLHLQAQTERLDAPSELLKHRRLVARIKTVQTERQLVAAKAAAEKAAAEKPAPAPKAEKPVAPKAEKTEKKSEKAAKPSKK